MIEEEEKKFISTWYMPDVFGAPPPTTGASRSELLVAVERSEKEDDVHVEMWWNEHGIFLRVPKSTGCEGYAACQGSSLMICGGVAQRCSRCPFPDNSGLLEAWKTVLSETPPATAADSFISVLYLLAGTWTKMRLTLRKVESGQCNASGRLLQNDYAFVSEDGAVVWSLASAAVYFFVHYPTSCGRNQPINPHEESIYLESLENGSYAHTQDRSVPKSKSVLDGIPFALALSRDDIHLSNVEASALEKVSLNILPFVLQCVVYKSPLNPVTGINVFDLVYTEGFWDERNPEWHLMVNHLSTTMPSAQWKRRKTVATLEDPKKMAERALAKSNALLPYTAHVYRSKTFAGASMYLRAERDYMAVPVVDCGQYGDLDIVCIMQDKFLKSDTVSERFAVKGAKPHQDDRGICKIIVRACNDSYLRMAVKATVDPKDKELVVEFTDLAAGARMLAEVERQELADANACAEAVLASESTHTPTLEFAFGRIDGETIQKLIKDKYGNPTGMNYGSIDQTVAQCAHIAKIVPLLDKAEGNAVELQAAFDKVHNNDLVWWAINAAFNTRASRQTFSRLGEYCAKKMAERTQARALIAYIDENTKVATQKQRDDTALFFMLVSHENRVFQSRIFKVQNYLIDAMFQLVRALKKNKEFKRCIQSYGGIGFWLECGYGAAPNELEKSAQLLELCKTVNAKKSAKEILAKVPKDPQSTIKLCHLWQAYRESDKPRGSFSAYISKNYSRALVDFPDCDPPGQFAADETVVHKDYGRGKILGYTATDYMVEFKKTIVTDIDEDDLSAV